MRINVILLSLLTIFMLSCQKENLTAPSKQTNYAKNVKKHYDIVKAYHNNQIVERDGISLSLDQALDEIEMLFSLPTVYITLMLIVLIFLKIRST